MDLLAARKRNNVIIRSCNLYLGNIRISNASDSNSDYEDVGNENGDDGQDGDDDGLGWGMLMMGWS